MSAITDYCLERDGTVVGAVSGWRMPLLLAAPTVRAWLIHMLSTKAGACPWRYRKDREQTFGRDDAITARVLISKVAECCCGDDEWFSGFFLLACINLNQPA